MFDLIKSKLRNILLEGKDKNKTYDYGCVMFYFDIDKKDWDAYQDLIDEDDVTTADGLGRETEPHVTLLYGLHKTIKDEEVESIIDDFKGPEIRFNHLSIFENDNFDVVKFTIRNESLNKMNKKLKVLDHTNDFPKYEPHVTLAYVKKGEGSKYNQTLKGDLDKKLIPTKIVYSRADGTKKEYKIN
jgi:2'-5' RNA ligase